MLWSRCWNKINEENITFLSESSRIAIFKQWVSVSKLVSTTESTTYLLWNWKILGACGTEVISLYQIPSQDRIPRSSYVEAAAESFRCSAKHRTPHKDQAWPCDLVCIWMFGMCFSVWCHNMQWYICMIKKEMIIWQKKKLVMNIALRLMTAIGVVNQFKGCTDDCWVSFEELESILKKDTFEKQYYMFKRERRAKIYNSIGLLSLLLLERLTDVMYWSYNSVLHKRIKKIDSRERRKFALSMKAQFSHLILFLSGSE